MPQQSLRTLFVGLVLVLLGRTGSADVIEFGSLSLDWPSGTAVKSTRPPVELALPGGAKVLVTVMRIGPRAGQQALDVEQLQASNEKILADVARRSGRVVIPLDRQALPDGSTLLSIGSETSTLFSTGYFLQYALLTRAGQLGYVSAEGRGDAQAPHALVGDVMRRARWSDDAGSAAERTAFTERVAGMFRSALGDADVLVDQPLTLKLGPLQANLDRVHAYCRRNAEGCAAELDRYVKTVADMRRQADVKDTPEALRMVVRTIDYGQALHRTAQQAATPEKVRDSEPLPQPFVDGLIALPVVDGADSLRMLNRSGAQTLGLSPEQAQARGLANLRAALKPLADVARPVAAGRIGTVAGDAYESSRLLLHGDWAALAQAQAGVLVVALPATDTLLYGADASDAGLGALRAAADEVWQRAPNRLSLLLLRWTDTGWQRVR